MNKQEQIEYLKGQLIGAYQRRLTGELHCRMLFSEGISNTQTNVNYEKFRKIRDAADAEIRHLKVMIDDVEKDVLKL